MSSSHSEPISEDQERDYHPMEIQRTEAEEPANEIMNNKTSEHSIVEDYYDPQVYKIVRHKESEADMIRSLAAETIQECYKRYKECKSSIRAARVLRENTEVENIAADTIKGALRAYVSQRSRVKKELEDGKRQEQRTVNSDAAGEDHDLPLPDNWEKRYDDLKKRHYYVDHNNKKTQWKHPLSTRKPKSSKKSKPESDSPLVVETSDGTDNEATTAAHVEETSIAVTDKITTQESSPVVTGAKYGICSSIENEKGMGVDACVEMEEQFQEKIEDQELDRVGMDAPDLEAEAIEAEESGHKELVTALPPAAKVWDGVNVVSSATCAPDTVIVKSSAGKGDHLVVDEAFSIAFQEQCASVLFKPREMLLLLDALECDVPPALLERSDQLSSSIPSIELPVLHEGPLASVLTTYVRNYGLVANSRSFTLPESQAKLAVRRICGLISGFWAQEFPAPVTNADLDKTIRSKILDNCDGSRGKAARPVYWSERQVKAVIGSMGFDVQKFAGFSGEDLLAFEASRVESEMNVTRSLLLTRFAVYQQVLRSLDKWWDLGYRPGDTYREAYRSAFLGSLMLPFQGEATVESGTLQQPSEKAASSKGPKSRQRKRRGSFQGLRKATESKFKWGNVDAKQGDKVDLAPLESLMHCWVPLNRAYGWGVPLEVLTFMGGRIGGKRGTVETDFGSPAVQGCCWVSVQDKSAQQSLAGLGELQILHPLSGSVESSLVLVPLMCLRKADDSSIKIGVQEGHMNPADVVPGLLVKVTNRKALERAFDRFEWWDRPSPDALGTMATQMAEVISTTELKERRRVGVRILNTDIFDAIPLEALIPMNLDHTIASVASNSQEVPERVPEPHISARVSMNRSKVRNKGIERPVTMAPKSMGYTPPFALSEEGKKQDARARPASATTKSLVKSNVPPDVVAGESENALNEYYLNELRSSPGYPFLTPEGGDEAVPESSPTHATDEVQVREPPKEPREEAELGEGALREQRPTKSEQRSPTRVSTSTLQFDSKNAKWAMSTSPDRVMPGTKRCVSPTARVKKGHHKHMNQTETCEDRDSNPRLFIQDIGIDELGSENYYNGATASPGAARRREEKRQRQKRPSTASGPQRVVGRPVLASRDDIVEWVDGSAFYVAGNAKLGARQIG